MKERLLQLVRYNEWANLQFIKLMNELSSEQLDTEITSSFPSIRKTVYHMWGAEDIWLQRLQKAVDPVWPILSFKGDFAAALAKWALVSQALTKFVSEQDDISLKEAIHVVNMKGEHHADLIADVLQHIANHSSYHRGQLVTMLRQIGVVSIPQTDMIAFTRSVS